MTKIERTPQSRNRRYRVPLAAAFAGLGTILLLSLPFASAVVVLAPPYAAGCNGTATGARVVHSVGTVGHTLVGPALASGALTNDVNASTVGGYSAIETTSYFFVGCYRPAAAHVGVFANFTWNVSYHPYLHAVCPTNNSTAAASGFLNVTANIHEAAPPYYLQIPSPYHHVWTHNVRCATWNPGTAVVKFVISVGPVNVARNTTYDFYSALWNNVTASATPPGAANAFDFVNATLTGVVCTCP